MFRSAKLVIRLSPAEQEAIRRLAEAERLPESTMARAILLKEAEARRRAPISTAERMGSCA